MESNFALNDFLPFRLNVLAQTVSERLSAIYASKFNLDIPQWRILAHARSPSRINGASPLSPG